MPTLQTCREGRAPSRLRLGERPSSHSRPAFPLSLGSLPLRTQSRACGPAPSSSCCSSSRQVRRLVACLPATLPPREAGTLLAARGTRASSHLAAQGRCLLRRRLVPASRAQRPTDGCQSRGSGKATGRAAIRGRLWPCRRAIGARGTRAGSPGNRRQASLGASADRQELPPGGQSRVLRARRIFERPQSCSRAPSRSAERLPTTLPVSCCPSRSE